MLLGPILTVTVPQTNLRILTSFSVYRSPVPPLLDLAPPPPPPPLADEKDGLLPPPVLLSLSPADDDDTELL